MTGSLDLTREAGGERAGLGRVRFDIGAIEVARVELARTPVRQLIRVVRAIDNAALAGREHGALGNGELFAQWKLELDIQAIPAS